MKQMLFVLIACGLLPLQGQAQAKYVPPPDAKVVKVNGKEYISGDLYLPGHADTLSLKQLGCRDLEFSGRSVGTVKYHALWPVELAQSEMPKLITGVDYDRMNANFPLSDYESPIVKENPTDPDYLPTVRTFNPEYDKMPLSRSGPGWQAVKSPADVVMDRDEYRKYIEGENPYSCRWDGKAIPNTYKNPRLTGTFRVLPEEDGPFHKKENVGTADPHTTGNFQLTPIETMQRSSIQTRDFSNGNPYTGTTTWGVSDYQPRDGWRGVGYHQFPVCYPSQYQQGIQVPRRGR
jgi:hypothetical protein